MKPRVKPIGVSMDLVQRPWIDLNLVKLGLEAQRGVEMRRDLPYLGSRQVKSVSNILTPCVRQGRELVSPFGDRYFTFIFGKKFFYAHVDQICYPTAWGGQYVGFAGDRFELDFDYSLEYMQLPILRASPWVPLANRPLEYYLDEYHRLFEYYSVCLEYGGAPLLNSFHFTLLNPFGFRMWVPFVDLVPAVQKEYRVYLEKRDWVEPFNWFFFG